MQSPKRSTNRLANETSPYLLQHAHNPVDWYPWSEEAFAKAKSEDKPVLLSIGYSACHWCHVMERESFEDEKIASIMNERFVNIKVDMEERPDVDKIYMNFVQMTTGSGGWPMTVFLTPDQKPFFGGTYFPPQPRFNLPSFEQILVSVSSAYADNREEVLRSANDILGEIRRIAIAESDQAGFGEDLLETAYLSFERSFDRRNGGFGGAPKFPAPMSLEFLLRYFKRTSDDRAAEIVIETCRKMAFGGIFDQLGGGFHRYTVDANWLTPHFEKMLYDNAQLARFYLHLYQLTGDEFYERIVRETLDYVLREMTDAKGGFYSAQDADSEGVEGKFFVWTPAEIREVLDQDAADAFCAFYDVTEQGNFEGKSILRVTKSIAGTADALGIAEEELASVLEEGRKKLFSHRESRVKPFRDEKVLTAWNGLMLAAFAEAAMILRDDKYMQAARNNADFLLEELRTEDGLLRTWKDGKAKLQAYVEDYSNLADGLIELYQASGEDSYLFAARELSDEMIASFWDEESGGLFFTASDHEELIVRTKDFNDNATPSGNSAAADVLLRLSRIFSDQKYERFAMGILRLVAPMVRRYPGAFGRAISAMEFAIGDVKEIVIIGSRSGEFENILAENYFPLKVVLRAAEPDTGSALSLLQGRDRVDGKTTVYVCENGTCRLPATDKAGMKKQLGIG
ncbi:MAG: thioredoxin domain-containing protein [Acidobacteria bacterium]|nr:MAG: thioredoxin domain-containing protein [Acidobacteriota bacterium]REK02155.1 MAG: thioredoxin domain-containing protein [Acidobacteriota bacterium]REK14043.1 MAG: thioredoxin domain-containing protein [Acidobacteriota bacterium]REK42038.1 MAG: thioredoxin domain-containing protein [Acidobacteriota bacterium]